MWCEGENMFWFYRNAFSSQATAQHRFLCPVRTQQYQQVADNLLLAAMFMHSNLVLKVPALSTFSGWRKTKLNGTSSTCKTSPSRCSLTTQDISVVVALIRFRNVYGVTVAFLCKQVGICMWIIQINLCERFKEFIVISRVRKAGFPLQ